MPMALDRVLDRIRKGQRIRTGMLASAAELSDRTLRNWAEEGRYQPVPCGRHEFRWPAEEAARLLEDVGAIRREDRLAD